jgi:hypothetical protein
MFYRYLFLSLFLASMALLFMNLPQWRTVISLIMGLSYFFWGVITHYLDKDLHWLVAMEYLIFSLLAVFMLIFLSLRA